MALRRCGLFLAERPGLLVEAIRTMTATTLAAVSALEVVGFGEYNEALF